MSNKLHSNIIPKPNRYPLGESAWQWTFGDAISIHVNHFIHQLVDKISTDETITHLGVHDLVPTYHALAVYFTDNIENSQIIANTIEKHIQTLATHIQTLATPDNEPINSFTQQHILPVDYVGSDIERVAKQNNLTPAKIINLHTSVAYQVAMIGFLPHFPYLLGLPTPLETPRLSTPRAKVPAGSVAIAGKQTGIYPALSPGGWNILGYTDPALLETIKPGDLVRFKCQ